MYAEFDNKQAGKLEAALETAIPKVVRKQDVPEWYEREEEKEEDEEEAEEEERKEKEREQKGCL